MALEKIKNIKKLSGFKNQNIHDIMQQRLAARMSTGQADFQALMERVDFKNPADTKVEGEKKIDNTDNSQRSKVDAISEQYQEKADFQNTRTQRPRLMDAVSDHHRKRSNVIDERFSVEQIVDESKDIAQVVSQLRETLTDPNVELKRSTQRLLQEKLANINENLQVALSKVGLEHMMPLYESRLATGAKKFIDMLTHSQRSLEGLGTRISMLSESGELSPASMLTVQIKMHTVVQELEFFTSLLSKSVESVKTIMNVQV